MMATQLAGIAKMATVRWHWHIDTAYQAACWKFQLTQQPANYPQDYFTLGFECLVYLFFAFKKSETRGTNIVDLKSRMRIEDVFVKKLWKQDGDSQYCLMY